MRLRVDVAQAQVAIAERNPADSTPTRCAVLTSAVHRISQGKAPSLRTLVSEPFAIFLSFRAARTLPTRVISRGELAPRTKGRRERHEVTSARREAAPCERYSDLRYSTRSFFSTSDRASERCVS